MNFVGFLTSRGFALFLLIVSAGILIIWNRFSQSYPSVFLIVPVCLFFSISFFVAKRVKSAFLKGAVDLRFRGSIVFHIGMLVIIVATSFGHLTRFFAVLALPQ